MIRGFGAGTLLLCWRHIRAPIAAASVQTASGTKSTKKVKMAQMVVN
jgi:hypothetical protein